MSTIQKKNRSDVITTINQKWAAAYRDQVALIERQRSSDDKRSFEYFIQPQWREKVKEISEIGFEYLVLQEVALDGKAIYPSKLAPQYKLGCDDPLEAVLAAGDEFGIKFFLSNDF